MPEPRRHPPGCAALLGCQISEGDAQTPLVKLALSQVPLKFWATGGRASARAAFGPPISASSASASAAAFAASCCPHRGRRDRCHDCTAEEPHV